MKTFTFVGLLSLLAMLSACGGSDTGTGSTNTNSANANTAISTNSNNPLAVTTPTPEQTTNNAPTLTPVVHEYYTALKNKDDAALRRVLTRDFIARAEADMREEKKTNLAAFFAELEKVPERPVEVRNERIEGDKAVAEIRGGSYVAWTKFAFAKENGRWKFTGGSPEIESVTKPADK